MVGGVEKSQTARSALIVATSSYEDPELRALRGAAADAAALAEVLADARIGNFEVSTVLDRPAHEVAEAIEGFFADRARAELLLVHLSGHGIKNPDGELHFAMSNTKLNRLAATSVSAQFVNHQMNGTRARSVVLFLDCCYAGAFHRGMSTRGSSAVDLGERFAGQGRAVITASGALEYAFEDGHLIDGRPQPSVFTTAIVHGLATGLADRDRDGWVGLDELYEYIHDQVRAANPNQTPSMWTFGLQGDLHLARRKDAPVADSTAEPEFGAPAAPPYAAVTLPSGRPARRRPSWPPRTWRGWAPVAGVVALIALVALFAWWHLRDQRVDTIPSDFAGHWEGQTQIRGGSINVTVDLVEGATGGMFDVPAVSSEVAGDECLIGDLTLTGGSADELAMTFAPINENCSSGTARLRLDGGDMVYELHPDGAGTKVPVSARLSAQ